MRPFSIFIHGRVCVWGLSHLYRSLLPHLLCLFRVKSSEVVPLDVTLFDGL